MNRQEILDRLAELQDALHETNNYRIQGEIDRGTYVYVINVINNEIETLQQALFEQTNQ